MVDAVGLLCSLLLLVWVTLVVVAYRCGRDRRK